MLLTSFLDQVVEYFEKLTRREIFVLLICILVLVVIINGITTAPHDYYWVLSQNPFATRTDIHHANYWQESVLLPVIVFYSHLTSRYAYYLLCLLIFLTAFLVLAYLILKHYTSLAALIFTTLIMTSPLTTVILFWLGTPDSLTFALTIPFLFSDSALVMFLGATLGAMNHITGLIAMIEIVILRSISQGAIKAYHLISVSLGGITGYLLVKAFLALNDIELVISRLDFIFSRDLSFWVHMNAHNFPVSILSFFNVQWLILFASLIMFFRVDRVYYSALLIILFFNFGITFFTEDTTRVFSLLSWGVYLDSIFHSYKLSLNRDEELGSYRKQYLSMLLVMAFLSLISLRYYSYAGRTYATGSIYEFFKYLFETF